MSSRPREAKKLRRLEKVMRRTPPTSIDLVQWLRDRRYADTAGAARKILTDGRVKVDGEIVGRVELSEDNFLAWPLIPAHMREGIRVHA